MIDFSAVAMKCTTTPIIPIPSPDQAATNAPVSCVRSPVEAHLFPEYPRGLCGAPDCFVCSRALFCGAPENTNWRFQVKKVLAAHFSDKKQEIPQLERKRRRDPWFNDHFKKLRREAEDRVATEAAIVHEHAAFQAQLNQNYLQQHQVVTVGGSNLPTIREQFAVMKTTMKERMESLQRELDDLQSQLEAPDDEQTQFNDVLRTVISNLENQTDDRLEALRTELVNFTPSSDSEIKGGEATCGGSTEGGKAPPSSSSSSDQHQGGLFDLQDNFFNVTLCDMDLSFNDNCFTSQTNILLDGIVNI